jgi:hypothetical protein
VKSNCLICIALVLMSVNLSSTAQGNTERYYPLLTSAEPYGAPVDTIYLIGEPGSGTGDFQTENPLTPDWEGWTSVDRTINYDIKWHIDTYNAELLDEGSPNHAFYCGEVFPSCSETDPPEGYGNSYREYIDWWGTVDDPSASTLVTVQGILNYDNEPGYDYLYLRNEDSDGWNDVTFWNGTNFNTTTQVFEPVSFAFPVRYAANTYVGAGFNEVHLRFSAESDGAWSDEDCLWPTSGLAQIDNIEVDGNNGLISTYDDFESDLESSTWKLTSLHGVGNFAQIWQILDDIDPCRQNNTPQVAFIDDGIIEDCDGRVTLGTLGQTWTYGPGGYCVNYLGGCMGPTFNLHNEVWSPALIWPENAPDGLELSFEVYTHYGYDSAILGRWGIQFQNQYMQWEQWQYYPHSEQEFNANSESINKRYVRKHVSLTADKADHPLAVRIALGANEVPSWSFESTPTPAPYFDNVALRLFPVSGPEINAFAYNLAQDGFPTSGAITGDPNDLSIRFDMSADIAGDTTSEIVAGDSITFTVKAVRAGSELNGLPKLHYALRPNPELTVTRLFALRDSVDCTAVLNSFGEATPDSFCCDLPDSGFIFPGDVLHYYISGEEIIGGDPGTITRSTLPADLEGFGVFDDFDRPVPLYSPYFTVRGLPTLHEIDGDWQNGYTQPNMLLWDDYGHPDGESAWAFALSQLGYHRSVDYDLFATNFPGAEAGNGLGARATTDQIDGYITMLYTSGALQNGALGSGINTYYSGDKSPDIVLLDAWLQNGDRNLMLTGNHLFNSISNSIGGAFLSDWIGVGYGGYHISNMIGGLSNPSIVTLNAAALPLPMDFSVLGRCPYNYTFNVISLYDGTIALANFQDAVGADSGIPAVTYNETMGSRVVFSCVDFSLWGTPHGKSATSARAQNLSAILDVFGQSASGPATDTPGIIEFFTRNHPNPFNPVTRISFSVPQAGDVSVKIYNLRGELVRTLVDDVMPVSALVTREWLGRDDKGRDVSSGVYFYEVKTKGHSQTKKMALIR